jgi:hypothetical protein
MGTKTRSGLSYLVDSAVAERVGKIFARAERHKLNGKLR